LSVVFYSCIKCKDITKHNKPIQNAEINVGNKQLMWHLFVESCGLVQV